MEEGFKKWRRTFPTSLTTEVDDECHISQELMDLREDTLDSSVANILESTFVKSHQKLTQLIGVILLAVKFRPQNIELYAQLISKLINSTGEFICEIKPTLQRALFCRESVKSVHAFFLYKCVKENVFEVTEALKYILEIEKRSVSNTYHLLRMFAWFLPEFELEYHDEFIRFFGLLKRSCLPELKQLQDDVNLYQSECWHSYSELRDIGYNHHQIAKVLRSDDVDELKAMFDQNKVDLEGEIEQSFFEREEMLQSKPKMIQYAAYYGSVKCFEFITSHLARPDVCDKNQNNTAAFACAGGNSEILLKLKDFHVDFSTSPQIAALFHRNQIYEWLVAFIDKETFHTKVRNHVFQKAVISNNLSICLRYLEDGVNFNAVNGVRFSFIMEFAGFLLDSTSYCSKMWSYFTCKASTLMSKDRCELHRGSSSFISCRLIIHLCFWRA